MEPVGGPEFCPPKKIFWGDFSGQVWCWIGLCCYVLTSFVLRRIIASPGIIHLIVVNDIFLNEFFHHFRTKRAKINIFKIHHIQMKNYIFSGTFIQGLPNGININI